MTTNSDLEIVQEAQQCSDPRIESIDWVELATTYSGQELLEAIYWEKVELGITKYDPSPYDFMDLDFDYLDDSEDEPDPYDFSDPDLDRSRWDY